MLQVVSQAQYPSFPLLHSSETVPFPADEYLIMTILKWLPLQTQDTP